MQLRNGIQYSDNEAAALDELKQAVIMNVTSRSPESVARVRQAYAYFSYAGNIDFAQEMIQRHVR